MTVLLGGVGAAIYALAQIMYRPLSWFRPLQSWPGYRRLHRCCICGLPWGSLPSWAAPYHRDIELGLAARIARSRSGPITFGCRRLAFFSSGRNWPSADAMFQRDRPLSVTAAWRRWRDYVPTVGGQRHRKQLTTTQSASPRAPAFTWKTSIRPTSATRKFAQVEPAANAFVIARSGAYVRVITYQGC